MIARDLMTYDPIVACATDSIADAAVLMGTADVGSMPVVDQRDSMRLVGMLTDRDIVVRCTAMQHDATRCTVADHMTRHDLTTVKPDTSLTDIIDRMERFQVRRVPVVDAACHVLGVVAQADLARCVGPDNPELVEEVLARVSAPPSSSGW